MAAILCRARQPPTVTHQQVSMRYERTLVYHMHSQACPEAMCVVLRDTFNSQVPAVA